jgi:hypothetical protein
MARILIQAVHSDGESRRWTLSERIVAENLSSDHYVTQLIDRLSWATADAETLESSTVDVVSQRDRETRRPRPTTGSAGASNAPEGPGASQAPGPRPRILRVGSAR